jgi:hypothetical protein
LFNGATYLPGLVGSAFNFDGVDDYVELANDATLHSTRELTLSAWFRAYALTPE